MSAATPRQENPLAAGLERQPVSATALTIFGATGDLAQRKLLPALYNLAHEGALPERFHLVGISRSEYPDDEFRELAAGAIRRFSRRTPDEAVLTRLLADVRYVSGSFDDEEAYTKIGAALDGFDEADGGDPLNRCYYLSTAPAFFPVIVEALGRAGLSSHDGRDVRVVIEKPFGTSLAEAEELNRRVLAVFDERQVFRIDHYLGKETVQNILVFRFGSNIPLPKRKTRMFWTVSLPR